LKKINCKHGLNPKEEIRARRLARNVIEGNEKEFKERMKKTYFEWSSIKNKEGVDKSYIEYLEEKDKVLYSVVKRLGGRFLFYLSRYDLI